MGRTIPQSRIFLMLEEKRWKIYQKYLDKKNKKIFKNMISTVYFYNSACSYALNSLRINSILFSIILYHQNFFKKKDHVSNNIPSSLSSSVSDKKINMNSNIFPYDDILTKEIESWRSYAECLRKKDRKVFNNMLKNCHKYSQAINAKGKDYSTLSLLMTILLEHHKIVLNSQIKKNNIMNYNIDYVYQHNNINYK